LIFRAKPELPTGDAADDRRTVLGRVLQHPWTRSVRLREERRA
jgi:hypothetical protein